MKQLVCLLAVAAFMVVPANAIAIRMFFDTAGVDDGDTNLDGIAPAMINPELGPGGGRLYIWAQIDPLPAPPAYYYLSVGYNIHTTGDVTITGYSAWNMTRYVQTQYEYVDRWAGFATGAIQSPTRMMNYRGFGNPGSGNFGVRNRNLFNSDDQFTNDDVTDATLLGWIDVAGNNGGVFFEVGNATMARDGGGNKEAVYFGFGDEGDGIKGDDVDRASSMADATIVPEPSSLLLLGLAGLALRRR
jgi:hypothetical protein